MGTGWRGARCDHKRGRCAMPQSWLRLVPGASPWQRRHTTARSSSIERNCCNPLQLPFGGDSRWNRDAVCLLHEGLVAAGRTRGGDQAWIPGAAGHKMRLIDLDGMRKLLRREVDRAGGQVAWAKRHGLHPSTINKVVNEQRMPGRRMLTALQLQKVTAYRRHG